MLIVEPKRRDAAREGNCGDREIHDRGKKGTTFLYGLDAEGNVTDVDVEHPKAEAARHKRQAKEADRKVAAALRRDHPNILPPAYTSSQGDGKLPNSNSEGGTMNGGRS